MKSSSLIHLHCRSFTLRGVLLASVFVLFFFIDRDAMQGQSCTPACPTNWVCGNVTVTIPNPCGGPPSNLQILVEYCYPNPSGPVFPKTQITIQSIKPQSPCGLVNFTINDMQKVRELTLEAAGNGIIPCDSLPDCSGCDPDCICPGGYAEWIVTTGACMNDTSTGTQFFPCGDGHCVSLFEMCCIDGNPSARPLSMAPDADSCYGPNCFIQCDSWNSGLEPCERIIPDGGGSGKNEQKKDPSLTSVPDAAAPRPLRVKEENER